MRERFDKDGRLIIPFRGEIGVPKQSVERDNRGIVVKQAYCHNGHDLMADIDVDGHRAFRFIYVDERGSKETDIAISPVVAKCRKRLIKGSGFSHGEIVKVLCPHCREELPKLFHCECGAPIYMFYLDKGLDHDYGQSFCSRIGCVKASKLRLSKDALREFITDHAF